MRLTLVVHAVGVALILSGSPAAAQNEFIHVQGSDRVGIAIGWSRLSMDEGGATRVLLAERSYPGISYLSGGLQSRLNAPLLLTPGNRLPDRVKEEIIRTGASEVLILGGTRGVSSSVEQGLRADGYQVTRVGRGKKTVASAALAKEFFSDSTIGFLIRVRDDVHRMLRETITTPAAAAEVEAPVLLTRRGMLGVDARRYLKSSRLEQLFVIGNRAAISPKVVREARFLGVPAKRISAPTQAELAIRLIKQVWAPSMGSQEPSCVVLEEGLRSGSWSSLFPASLYAANNDCPPLLADLKSDPSSSRYTSQTEEDGEEECVIPAETLEYLESIFTENTTFTLGPFTDNCVEGLLAEEFGSGPGPSPSGSASPSSSPSPTGPASQPQPQPNPPSVGVTEGPELTGCAVEPADPASPSTRTVRFLFDDDISGSSLVANDFHIYRPDGTNFNGVSAQRSGSNVLVSFSENVVRGSVVCTVDFAAVAEFSGVNNPEGAEAIQNPVVSSGGETSAPDLESIGNFTTNQQGSVLVDYRFDEAVVSAVAQRFLLVLTDGSEWNGQAVVPDDDANIVTIQFAGTQSDIPFSQIARGAVLHDAVFDSTEDSNPTQAAEAAGDTTTPDLASARVISSNQVEYAFDDSVRSDFIDSTRFGIYNAAADIAFGNSATRSQTDSRVVVVTFGSSQESLIPMHSVVGAFVHSGAVLSATDLGAVPNKTDEVPLQVQSTSPGRTTLPDLIGVRIFTDPVSQRRVVRYTFDASVSQYADGAGGDDFTVNDFHLYDVNGTRFTPTTPFGTSVTGAPGSSAVIRQVSGDNTSVDVYGYTNAQADAARLGTVNDDSFESSGQNEDGSVPRFPEGDAVVDRS